jgi:hypothetical protein
MEMDHAQQAYSREVAHRRGRHGRGLADQYDACEKQMIFQWLFYSHRFFGTCFKDQLEFGIKRNRF